MVFSQEFNYKLFKKILPALMLSGTRATLINRERIPAEGAVILICNHRSPWDALVVSSLVDRYVSWVVADYNLELFWNRWLFQATGMIPVSVSGMVVRKSLGRMGSVLKAQQILGIFPEGQHYVFRGDYGKGPYKFQGGFAHLAHKFEVPVLPCLLKPLEERMKPLKIVEKLRRKLKQEHGVTLPGQQVIYKHVELHIGELVQPNIFGGRTKRWLMDHCWEVMNQIWEK